MVKFCFICGSLIIMLGLVLGLAFGDKDGMVACLVCGSLTAAVGASDIGHEQRLNRIYERCGLERYPYNDDQPEG
jgi:hypothetical protein